MARWALAIVVAMLAGVLSLAAQQASPASPNPTPQPNDCSQRTIPLTLIKSSNSTWDWQTLSLTVAGKAVPIDSMLATPQAPRVLVLVDTSGSMGPEPGHSSHNWGIGMLAAAFAVDATPLESKVSLGTFNKSSTLGEFESRRAVADKLVAIAQQEKPNHETAIYGALRDAAAQLQPVQFGDTIFLVSDGGDNRSGELQKKARQDLIAKSIRVFVFFVDSHEFKTAEEREGPALMTELADATGGVFIRGSWSKEWLASDDAKHLGEQIRNMVRWPHILQFTLDQPLQKAAKLKITPPDSRALELAYPRQALPCFALDAKSH